MLNDSRLSFRARGALAWLLDKPDDWTTNAEQMSGATSEGRDAVRAALTELETVGYLERKQWRDTKTKVWRSEWIVRERPERVSSDGEPAPDSQQQVSRPQVLNTEPTTDLANDQFSVTPLPSKEECSPPPWVVAGTSRDEWMRAQKTDATAEVGT